jgi:hypothetical protein
MSPLASWSCRFSLEDCSRTFIIKRCGFLSPERIGLTKKILIIALVLLLVSYVYLAVSPRSFAANPVTLYLDPATINNVSYTPGTTFNVSVKLDNVPTDPGVVGIQFNVTWDPAILKGTALTEVVFNEVTPPDQVDNIWKLKNAVANNSVSYAYTFQDITTAIDGGYAPISGNHTVAIITLTVVGTGKTSLNFAVGNIGDPSGNPIEHDTFGATFSNVAGPKPALLFVDPSEISNGSLGIGSSFMINVNIVNASDVGGLEFKLGFNASELNVISVVAGAIIPGSVTPTTEVDNVTGFARFNVTLSSPINGDGTLAVIQLLVMADNLKNSVLHLYNVSLVDSGGATLLFTTADGSFSNLKVIPGDLNHDGIVDILDAVEFSKSFGSTSSSERWNPEADINGDGQLDIFDLILIAMNFGKSA